MENNLKAYISQLGLKMNSDKAKIVECLRDGCKNIEILKFCLSIKHTTLTARLSDLTDDGIVKKTTTKGRYSIYRLTTPEERQSIVTARNLKRKERWIKLGKKMGWFDELLNN